MTLICAFMRSDGRPFAFLSFLPRFRLAGRSAGLKAGVGETDFAGGARDNILSINSRGTRFGSISNLSCSRMVGARGAPSAVMNEYRLPVMRWIPSGNRTHEPG